MFKVLGCLIVTLVTVVACSRNNDWTQLPTPDGYATYEIQQNSISYVNNSKGEKAVVVVVKRHVKMPQETEMFKLHVTYADCKAGHGMLDVFDMYGNDKAVSAFAKGVKTDSGALARAACAEADVQE
jgi:hypothetical protein